MVMTMADERMLKRMGIDPRDPPPAGTDPHCECIARWLEERDKREIAERSIVSNAQAYEALSEARDREIAFYRLRAWSFGLLALTVIIVSVVLLVLR